MTAEGAPVNSAPNKWAVPSLAIALVLGTVVRAIPVLGSDFPVGDGGMFAVMVEDLRRNGLALPAFTSYNGGDIPFAYPPLGLYVVAVLPADPVSTEMWLPLVWSVLGMVAFWVLAQAVLDDEAAGVAAVAFALLPGAYAWQIMGGGVTRALELLLGLAALAAVAWLLEKPGFRRALSAAILAGLATLTHPIAPFAIVVGSSLLWIALSRSARGALWLAVAALIAAAIVGPWVSAVASVHGLDPFVSALNTHVGVPERWFAVVIAIVLSMMVAWIAVPIADHLHLRGPFLVVAVTVALMASLASRLVPGSVVYAVPEEARRQISGLGAAAAPATTFAVWTGNIGDDHIVEWFPALASRISIGTYQGAEWRGDWRETVSTHIGIQKCRCSYGANELWEWNNDRPRP